MGIRQTHTYAELELSQSAYDEISRKLKEAGYDHSFMDDGAVGKFCTIDMHGIGVTRAETAVRCTQCGWIVDTTSQPEFPKANTVQPCGCIVTSGAGKCQKLSNCPFDNPPDIVCTRERCTNGRCASVGRCLINYLPEPQ